MARFDKQNAMTRSTASTHLQLCSHRSIIHSFPLIKQTQAAHVLWCSAGCNMPIHDHSFQQAILTL